MPDVRCPMASSHRAHETTDRYVANTVVTGAMIRVKAKYRAYGVPNYSTGWTHSGLRCPLCGACYCDSRGRIRLHDADPVADAAPVEPVVIAIEQPPGEPDVMAEAVKRGILKEPAPCITKRPDLIDPKIARAMENLAKARAARAAKKVKNG